MNNRLAFGLSVINTAMAHPLLKPMDSSKARVQLATIGLQESRFEYRVQQHNGPAHGFWQFERGGGCKGVLQHQATKRIARELCRQRGVLAVPEAVWASIINDDILACGFARLLLYSDPAPLPDPGDDEGSWAYYYRNWRPGDPRPETWPDFHQAVRHALIPEES